MLVRQRTKQKKVTGFVIPEPAGLLAGLHQFRHVDPAVMEPALGGDAFVVVNDIPAYLADRGQADQHAGAVAVAQAPLDVILAVKFGFDVVVFLNRSPKGFVYRWISHVLVCHTATASPKTKVEMN